jgi:hypothetical protein
VLYCFAVLSFTSLGRFYFVPDFGVLGAAWHILPEIETLLVIVDVVEMQCLYFI